jgi:hypothetical protein
MGLSVFWLQGFQNRKWKRVTWQAGKHSKSIFIFPMKFSSAIHAILCRIFDLFHLAYGSKDIKMVSYQNMCKFWGFGEVNLVESLTNVTTSPFMYDKGAAISETLSNGVTCERTQTMRWWTTMSWCIYLTFAPNAASSECIWIKLGKSSELYDATRFPNFTIPDQGHNLVLSDIQLYVTI